MEPNKTSQLISIVLSNPNSRWPCPHGSLRGDESTKVKTGLLVQTAQSEKEFRMAGKKHAGDWLKRLAAVILLVKFCCLLQNVIYPPPPLEAFNVDHKLGRTSGSAKDMYIYNNKTESTVMLAPTRALQVQLQWPPYFLVLNLLETKANPSSWEIFLYRNNIQPQDRVIWNLRPKKCLVFAKAQSKKQLLFVLKTQLFWCDAIIVRDLVMEWELSSSFSLLRKMLRKEKSYERNLGRHKVGETHYFYYNFISKNIQSTILKQSSFRKHLDNYRTITVSFQTLISSRLSEFRIVFLLGQPQSLRLESEGIAHGEMIFWCQCDHLYLRRHPALLSEGSLHHSALQDIGRLCLG